MPLKPFWSYYGSRYRLVPSYPRPLHRRIVEPFAGAAAYSLHYPDREVVLCDLDPQIVGIWQYLIGVSEQEILSLPDVVEHVDELGRAPQEARWLVGFWLGRCRSTPRMTVGAWMITESAERPGCFWGREARERIASQLQQIRHWRVRCADYRAMSDEGSATWFIDPPFRGSAGRRYRKGSSAIDFDQLGQWCRERPGQVLVCEQLGADWLPFAESAKGRGLSGERRTVLYYQQETISMKITKAEALSIAKALVLPPDRMEEIARFCARDGKDAMAAGLHGVYFALGDLLNQHPRLADEGAFWPEDEKLSLEPYAVRITADEAFAALRRHLGKARKFRPLTLLNTSIVTAEGTHELRRCSLELAREHVRNATSINSAVGHEATAQILTELLGVPVAVNRQAHVSKPGDVALVFKLKGRPPEGKILSREEMEAIGYEFFTLVHVAG